MAFSFMKSPYEKLRDAFFSLSDEDKAKFKAELAEIDKAEDEREIDKIDEGETTNSEVADQKAEEVDTESEVIGDDIDKAEDEVKADEATESENTADAVSDEPASLDEAPKNPETGFNEQLSDPSTTEPAANVEQTPEELNSAPSVDYKAMQDVLDGLNAKYEALESKFNELVEKYGKNEVTEDENADVGISGYGKNEVNLPEEDDRLERVKKALGYKVY